MEKKTFWPFSVRNFPQDMNIPVVEFEVDPNVTKMIYEHRFSGKTKENALLHLNKFNERCKVLNLTHANANVIKVNLFPYSLAGKALDWILKWPPKNFSNWFMIRLKRIYNF